jgi:hypothetical protein
VPDLGFGDRESISDGCRDAPTYSERDGLATQTFEIVVRGRLSPALVAAIKGFEVTNCEHGMTRLVGSVPDQSRLHGTLELLRDLNIELSSIVAIGPDEIGSAGQPGD